MLRKAQVASLAGVVTEVMLIEIDSSPLAWLRGRLVGRSCGYPFRFDDCASDDFGDLRDNGISKCAQFVGNPIA